MHLAIGSDSKTAEARSPRRAGWLAMAPPRDVLVAAAAFLVVTLMSCAPDFRAAVQHIYWEDWADQSKYVASARAFAHGDLDPARHWYPLLYPLALAALGWLPMFAAALIVNGLCYTLAYVGFREVAARFGLTEARVLLLFVATTLVGRTLGPAWVDPWTTTLSSALIWLALARLCRAYDETSPPPSASQSALTGVLLGLIPLCRPADLIVSAIIGTMLAARALRTPGGLRSMAALVGGGVAVVAPYLALYLSIYGPHPSDYMKLSAAFGLDFASLGAKAVALLIEPRPLYPYGSGVLARFPWVALGLAGLAAGLLRPERRRLALLIGAPALAYAVVMIAYVDLLPSGLWALRNFHYFKWLMPLMGLFAYDFVGSFARAKVASLVGLCLVLAATTPRLVVEPALPDAPARLLVFSAPDVEWGRLYFENSVIADRDGVKRNLFEFHQVPDARGLVYAEALRRDFAGGERWTDPPPSVVWPAEASGPNVFNPILGREGRAPLARYRARLDFGWPCWLPPYLCPTALPSGRPSAGQG